MHDYVWLCMYCYVCMAVDRYVCMAMYVWLCMFGYVCMAMKVPLCTCNRRFRERLVEAKCMITICFTACYSLSYSFPNCEH